VNHSNLARVTGKLQTTGKLNKPAKPHRDFPLFAHNTGRWAKKIRGRIHYFGRWNDPDAALKRYLDQKDDLLAGRKPRRPGDGLIIRDLCNRFLTAKRHRVTSGEVQLRTWRDYHETCKVIVRTFGRCRQVEDLRAEDFMRLRARLASGRGLEALGNQVQRSRTLFKFAWDNRLIKAPVSFGPDFRRPGRSARRRARLARPQRLFSAHEICALHDMASIPLRAMILLGVNAGLGNTDCASLRLEHLDFDNAILDYPRPKTGVQRRATLWPNTVAALRLALSVRPRPRSNRDADLVFVTRCGHQWVRFREKGHVDSINLEFTKLLEAAGIRRRGVSFYGLRHTFETIAGETGDQAAVDRIMGHEAGNMATVYREWTKDGRENERLRRVTEHVRQWLLAKPTAINAKSEAEVEGS